MAEETGLAEERGWTILDLPLRSLAALGEAGDLTAGALSPLGRVAAPDGPADRVGMVGLLDEIEGVSPWAPAALLDPHLTVGIIVGDEDAPAIRQYAWPDAEGRGPGFEFAVTDEALQMRGPVDAFALREGLLGLLAPGELPVAPAVAMTLSGGQMWVLAALSDAWRTSLAVRRLSRLGGKPQGVMAPAVIEAWGTGLERRNPGWAVSLLAMLLPDAVPGDFARGLRGILEEMDDAELVMLLEGELSAGPGATIVFGEGLERLIASLAGQHFMFGLTVQRLRAPGEVELTALGGWRTPNALWLVDLAGIETDEVELVLANEELVEAAASELLGAGADESFTMETPYTAEALRERLAAPVSEGAKFCRHCGAETVAGARFCRGCGKAL
jgi:hypothetical protein